MSKKPVVELRVLKLQIAELNDRLSKVQTKLESASEDIETIFDALGVFLRPIIKDYYQIEDEDSLDTHEERRSE